MVISVALAVVSALGIWWFVSSHKGGAKDEAAAPAVDVATVKVGTFTERVKAQGRVGPPAGSSARLSFAESGIVSSIDVRVGDRVAAGAPVARLHAEPFAAALAQAQADASAALGAYGGGTLPAAALQSAQAKLAVARARLDNLEARGPAAQSDQIGAETAFRQAQLKTEADRAAVARGRVLLEGGVIAEKDLQAAQNQLASDEGDVRAAQARLAAADAGFTTSLASARADYSSATNDLKTAQAQRQILSSQRDSAVARLHAAQVAYNAAVLRAPADGVVIAVLKHPGEAVDPATPAIEIGPGDARAATLNVPAQTAQRIHVGDLAHLRLPRSEVESSGHVTAVVPVVDPLTQSATVTVSGTPAGAVPGDAVEATIVVGVRSGPIVPTTAVVEDPQSGKTLLFVQTKDGSFAARDVRVDASDASLALIGRGVKPGERVASQGSYELLAPPGG